MTAYMSGAVSTVRLNGFIREAMLLHHILRTSKSRVLPDCQYRTTSYPSSFAAVDNAVVCERAFQPYNNIRYSLSQYTLAHVNISEIWLIGSSLVLHK